MSNFQPPFLKRSSLDSRPSSFNSSPTFRLQPPISGLRFIPLQDTSNSFQIFPVPLLEEMKGWFFVPQLLQRVISLLTLTPEICTLSIRRPITDGTDDDLEADRFAMRLANGGKYNACDKFKEQAFIAMSSKTAKA